MSAQTISHSYKSQSHPLVFLDGLRGFAALYVMIGHARWFLWEGADAFHANQHTYSLLNKLQVYFFSLFKYGHQMVLFFFVLSGFVIHLKQAKKLNDTGTFSLDGYFWRRAKRIVPPVIFALMLTFFCDRIVEQISASIYTRTTPIDLINSNISFDHDLTTLIGNLLFVQETYVPVFGSNGPLWSLKYEWWFYIIYPILLVANKKNVVYSLLLIAVLSALSLVGWSWGIKLLDDVLAYLICWWLGCFCADIYVGRIKIPVWMFYLAGCCLFAIPLNTKLFLNSNILKDVIISIGFWGVLSILLEYSKRGAHFGLLTRMKVLGDFSYSLYVIHVPLLVLANGVLLNYTGNHMPQTMLFVWLCIPLMLLIAYLVHLGVERPFTGYSRAELKKAASAL
ncbi:MAG: acyltransferase family protein [Chitinophagaceae bacterium]